MSVRVSVALDKYVSYSKTSAVRGWGHHHATNGAKGLLTDKAKATKVSDGLTAISSNCCTVCPYHSSLAEVDHWFGWTELFIVSGRLRSVWPWGHSRSRSFPFAPPTVSQIDTSLQNILALLYLNTIHKQIWNGLSCHCFWWDTLSSCLGWFSFQKLYQTAQWCTPHASLSTISLGWQPTTLTASETPFFPASKPSPFYLFEQKKLVRHSPFSSLDPD
jgi:hypothetical protein